MTAYGKLCSFIFCSLSSLLTLHSAPPAPTPHIYVSMVALICYVLHSELIVIFRVGNNEKSVTGKSSLRRKEKEGSTPRMSVDDIREKASKTLSQLMKTLSLSCLFLYVKQNAALISCMCIMLRKRHGAALRLISWAAASCRGRRHASQRACLACCIDFVDDRQRPHVVSLSYLYSLLLVSGRRRQNNFIYHKTPLWLFAL